MSVTFKRAILKSYHLKFKVHKTKALNGEYFIECDNNEIYIRNLQKKNIVHTIDAN